MMSKEMNEAYPIVRCGVKKQRENIFPLFRLDALFKTRIAQGMLTAGSISGLLGVSLPGPGTIYILLKIKSAFDMLSSAWQLSLRWLGTHRQEASR